MLLPLWFPVLFIGARAESMQRQCLCTEFDHCIETAEESVEQCAFKCKSHLARLGGNYAAVRQCILDQRPRIQKGVDCARAALPDDVCAASPPGKMIPRLQPDAAVMSEFRETTAALSRAGLLAQAAQLLVEAKGAAGCLVKCGQATDCAKMGCSLAIPSINEAITMGTSCALEAGFNTQVAREVCDCLVHAGLKQLAPHCPKIDDYCRLLGARCAPFLVNN